MVRSGPERVPQAADTVARERVERLSRECAGRGPVAQVATVEESETMNDNGGNLVAQEVLANEHREQQRAAMMQKVAHAGDTMAEAVGELIDVVNTAEGLEAMLGTTTAVYQALWQVGQLGEMLFDSAFCAVPESERAVAREQIQKEAHEWLSRMREQLGI
jgi:hypothetical protein